VIIAIHMIPMASQMPSLMDIKSVGRKVTAIKDNAFFL
jgi:hypothetical protein